MSEESKPLFVELVEVPFQTGAEIVETTASVGEEIIDNAGAKTDTGAHVEKAKEVPG